MFRGNQIKAQLDLRVFITAFVVAWAALFLGTYECHSGQNSTTNDPADAQLQDDENSKEEALARASCELYGACAKMGSEQTFKKTYNHDICAGGSNAKIRNRKFFCDDGLRFPNPYAISASAFDDQPGTPACRYYLLATASTQAKAALKDKNDPSDILTLGSRLGAVEPDCLRSHSLGNDALIADSAKITTLVALDDKETGAKYCKLVKPTGCKALGGQLQKVQVMLTDDDCTEHCTTAGHCTLSCKEQRLACVAHGLILDKSCLDLKGATLDALKKAIFEATVKGPSCLAHEVGGIGGKAASSEFAKQGKQLHTQVCCGDTTCKSPVLPPQDQVTIDRKLAKKGVVGFTSESRFATIQLLGRGLKRPEQLSGELFHEMLHRLGLCKNPDHNDVGKTMAYKISCDASAACRTGYNKLTAAEMATYDDLYTQREVARERAKRGANNHDSMMVMSFMVGTEKGVSPGECACAGMATCPKGQPLFMLPPRYETDPVYACHASCFPESVGMKKSDTANARDLCASAADFGNFSAATLPAGSFKTAAGREVGCGY